MRRILIAGCGYVGAVAADLFQTAGWEVEGWTRSAESASTLSGKAYLVRCVDLSAADQVMEAAGNFDVVIHCASTRGGDLNAYRRLFWTGAGNLINRFANSKFIFVSSTSVYAQRDGSWVAEESPADPVHATGRILRETEELVLAHGGNVARLAGIYGPARSVLLKKLLNGQALVDRKNDRFINQVHRDDVAAALLLLAGRFPDSGEIYNVVDDKPVRQSEYYRWLAARLDRPLRPAAAAGPPVRKRGQGNKRVSNRKLRGIGWKLRYPSFIEGMEKSVLPSFNI